MMASNTPDNNAYRIEQLEAEVKALHSETKSLEARLNAEALERAKQERNNWKAGIMVIGSVAMTLFGLLWTYRDAIVRGTP